MFGRSFNNGSRLFEAQFSEQDGRILYRKGQYGEAREVSASERVKFTQDFCRNQKRLSWGFVLGLMLYAISVVSYETTTEAKLPGSSTIVIVILFGSIFLASFFYLWGSPERYLERRPVVAEALSRQERQTVFYKTHSYPQLAGITALLGFMTFNAYSDLNGTLWHLLWFWSVASICMMCAYRLVAKFVHSLC